MNIVIIAFPEYMDRGPEVFGPFDNEEEAQHWIDSILDSADFGRPDNDLSVATFTLTTMARPFDVDSAIKWGPTLEDGCAS